MKPVRELIYFLADLFGVNYLWRRLTSQQVRVLMYHGVGAGSLPSFYWTHLDREMFVRQVRYIKRKFEIVKLSTLLNEPIRRGKPVAAITFDDGLENTYTDAWPILREHGLCATCFVLPGLSETGHRIWADEIYAHAMIDCKKEIDLSTVGLGTIPAGSMQQRTKAIDSLVEKLKSVSEEKRQAAVAAVTAAGSAGDDGAPQLNLMTKEQIVELARSPEFEIAGHSDTHPIMSTLSPERQEVEIEACLARLKDWGVDSPPLFAYPNGRESDFDEHTVVALRRHGCRAAVTTIDGLWKQGSDAFRIARIAIGADISFGEFKARMSGLFYFMQALKQRFTGRSGRSEAEDG